MSKSTGNGLKRIGISLWPPKGVYKSLKLTCLKFCFFPLEGTVPRPCLPDTSAMPSPYFDHAFPSPTRSSPEGIARRPKASGNSRVRPLCLLNLTFYTKIVLTYWGKRYDVSVLQKRDPGTPGGRGFGGGAPILKKTLWRFVHTIFYFTYLPLHCIVYCIASYYWDYCFYLPNLFCSLLVGFLNIN